MKIHQNKEELLNLGEWFAVPNVYYDHLLKTMTAQEFCILGLIRRETEGFGVERKRMSQNYLARKSGLSRSTVQAVLVSLQAKGHILKTAQSDHFKADEWMLNPDLDLPIKVDRETVNLSDEVDRETVNSRPRDGQPMTGKQSTHDRESVMQQEINTKYTSKEISKELASDFLFHLQTRVSPAQWSEVFSGVEIKQGSDSLMVLEFANRFKKEIAEIRLGWIIRQVAEQVFGKDLAIHYEVRR